MPFVQGSVSAKRFKAHKLMFEADHIALLQKHDFNRTQPATQDNVTFGWSAGEHVLDAKFTQEKNLRGEFLHFALRVSEDKLPKDREKAFYFQHLASLVEEGRKPNAKQKREAKEVARYQVEQEAKDGRYRQHKLFPVVWDGGTGEVWFGTANGAHADRLVSLFETTFGTTITPISAASLVEGEWEPEFSSDVPAWCSEDERPDWLGNEFALWLLWKSHQSDEVIGTTTIMPSKTLTVECPLAKGGHDTFTHECPVQMPEVTRAVQAGKLPRKIGLLLADGGDVFTLVLQVEDWTVTGAKVPENDDVSAGPQKETDRLITVRRMFGVLDALFQTYLDVRGSDDWQEDKAGMNEWLLRVSFEAEPVEA